MIVNWCIRTGICNQSIPPSIYTNLVMSMFSGNCLVCLSLFSKSGYRPRIGIALLWWFVHTGPQQLPPLHPTFQLHSFLPTISNLQFHSSRLKQALISEPLNNLLKQDTILQQFLSPHFRLANTSPLIKRMIIPFDIYTFCMILKLPVQLIANLTFNYKTMSNAN